MLRSNWIREQRQRRSDFTLILLLGLAVLWGKCNQTQEDSQSPVKEQPAAVKSVGDQQAPSALEIQNSR